MYNRRTHVFLHATEREDFFYTQKHWSLAITPGERGTLCNVKSSEKTMKTFCAQCYVAKSNNI